jgi:hypothetical protein
MNVLAHGALLYSYFKKGFLFGVEQEFANFLPYATLFARHILMKEKAQILLLKSLQMVI